MNFQPTQLNERVQTLDILRGFSLLGILLVNMFGFYLPMPHIPDLSTWFTEATDIIWHQMLDIYVQSSFYPLFSMLFGYGLAMQFMKAQQTDQNFYRFASKRFIILFIIGMLHAIFIWWGDILATYAFCGFFALVFIRLKSGWLLSIGLALNALLHAFNLGILALIGALTIEMEELPIDIVMLQNAITAYGTGNWLDAFMQRLNDLSIQMDVGMWFSALFTILPYMLIGAAAAKWRLLERAKELKGFWISIAVIFVALGVFLKSLPINMGKIYIYEYIQVFFGGPILAIGYIAVFVVLCYFPVMNKVFSPLAKAGRMSMTLYIMQSILCTVLFYNFGFSLYGKIDVPTAVYIALGIFALQVILAELWLSKFTQGPLEAAVKRLTYGKMNSEK